jgi:two-component sensor histidine kinase
MFRSAVRGFFRGRVILDTTKSPVRPTGLKVVIDDFDWSASPIGPRAEWPLSLQAVVKMALGSKFPQAIVWGPGFTTIHNDAFLPILGRKSCAIGRSFADVWAETWDAIGPIAEKAYAGESTFIENYPLVINRNGHDEEAFFTFCYAPLYDDDGNVAGMIDTVIETTETVRSQEQLRVSEERFGAFIAATNDVVYRMSADWKEMRQLRGRGFLADTDAPSIAWQEEYLLDEDLQEIQAEIDKAIAAKDVFELEHRVRRADGSVGWTLSRAIPVLDEAGETTEWFGAAMDITDQKSAQEQQEVINREMGHRLKNTMAMVHAIATQTLKPVKEREHVEALEKRIHSLSRAHDVLFGRYWQKATLQQLITATLQRIVPSERLDLAGGDVTIGPKGALSLSLVLHELATNAVKYGSLSNDVGRISLDWHVEGVGEEAVFTLFWKETGGPPVREPSSKGFGSKLIRMGLIGTGGVDVSYDASGFQAHMTASLHQLQHTE